MKKLMCRFCIYALILALAAGIFGIFLNIKSSDLSENAALVKKVSKEGIL